MSIAVMAVRHWDHEDCQGSKKVIRPVGQPGGVGYDTGVDEAPVPDAGSTIKSTNYQ
jgi:hypothetical protein